MVRTPPLSLSIGLTVLPSRRWRKGNPRDRKSTRLNSSHSQISYAVFCLKKKKKKHATDILLVIISEGRDHFCHKVCLVMRLFLVTPMIVPRFDEWVGSYLPWVLPCS